MLSKKYSNTLISVYYLIYLLYQKKRYKNIKVFYYRVYAKYRKILEGKYSTIIVYSRHYFLMLKKRKTNKIKDLSI